MSRTHLLSPGHRLVDTEIDSAVIVLDVAKSGAVRLFAESGDYDRRRLSNDELLEWFDSGRVHFEDPEADDMLNPGRSSDSDGGHE